MAGKLFELLFSVRKGLGPAWVDKPVSVYIDDIQPEMTESEIKEAALTEAKRILRIEGYKDGAFIYKETREE